MIFPSTEFGPATVSSPIINLWLPSVPILLNWPPSVISIYCFCFVIKLSYCLVYSFCALSTCFCSVEMVASSAPDAFAAFSASCAEVKFSCFFISLPPISSILRFTLLKSVEVGPVGSVVPTTSSNCSDVSLMSTFAFFLGVVLVCFPLVACFVASTTSSVFVTMLSALFSPAPITSSVEFNPALIIVPVVPTRLADDADGKAGISPTIFPKLPATFVELEGDTELGIFVFPTATWAIADDSSE